MFPQPHSALPLPPRPSIERYRKIAKDLVKACRSGEPGSIRSWAEQWVATLVELSALSVTPHLPVNIDEWVDDVASFARRKLLNGTPGSRTCSLADAQFVIARSHGFQSWPKFTKHLEAIAQSSSPASQFEAAADAIVSGDLSTVRRLLREDPKLARARSAREHGATLLHYVAANGVEGYRQKTPPNIVEITEELLRAGADVDATAELYGAACTTLGLAATSVHPEHAGVQEALLRILLTHGAEVDRPASASRQQSMIEACLANGQPRAARFLAENGARVSFAGAAGLGRADLIESFFSGGRSRPEPTPKQLEEGFLYACRYGHARVVEFLLEKGADLAAVAGDGQTGLHLAAIGGHLDTVTMLLRHGAPLEAENAYGGTVLGQTLWSAAHDGDPDRYIAILEALVTAGAQLPERYASISARLDAWLERHGSAPGNTG